MKIFNSQRFLTNLAASCLLTLAALGTDLSANPATAKDLRTTIIEKVDTLQASNQRWIEINLSTQRLV
ncbi:MAG: hypothetical protein WBG70_16220, partial [Spirulinaceae cyanobacterium]